MKTLDDYLHIGVTSLTGDYEAFGNGWKWFNVTIDSIVVESWVNYRDNCVTVDFLKNELFLRESIGSVFVGVNNQTAFSQMSLEIFPVPRNLFTERTLKHTWLFTFGPNIATDGTPGRYFDHILELKQEVFLENDPSKNCVNYPTAVFESYNHCDKNFTLQTLADHYGTSLVPFWATLDLNNVTLSHFVDWSYDYGNLYDGTTKSDCPLPCTTTSVNARTVSVTVRMVF